MLKLILTSGKGFGKGVVSKPLDNEVKHNSQGTMFYSKEPTQKKFFSLHCRKREEDPLLQQILSVRYHSS